METIFIIIGALFFIIFATVKLKVHPVFSLIITAIMTGLFLGLDAKSVIATITEGFGKTLSSIGLIIAFGTTIGVFLEMNGGMQVIANKILERVSAKKSPLAMNIIGFIVSIPVFCDSGFVILSSLNKALSKKTGISLVVFAVALSTGLYAAHVFVPPTPGPLAAAAVIEADIGLVMLLGLLVAIPVSFTGYLWANKIGHKFTTIQDENAVVAQNAPVATSEDQSVLKVLLPLLIPILLIAFKSVAAYPTKPFGETYLFEIISFIGEPIIALLIGVFLAFLFSRKVAVETKSKWIAKALKESGSIILVTGAGGAFGNILRASNIANLLESESLTIAGAGLFISFLLAAILKTAQGSSTVAIITTAAIMAPLLTNFGLTSEFEKALSVLAIGTGAMTVSHVNDSYFWVVSQFSHLEVNTALKSHTLATLFQGLVGIALLLLIQLFFS